jgi:hypothetical protein
MRRAIVIAGMHRSGTSCVSRVLSLCGLSLPATLVVPGEGRENDANSRSGFWESEPIRDLHEALLASAGSSWDDLREFPAEWLASRHRMVFERSAVACLLAEFGDAPRFVLKDPRVCRLVPFWLGVLAKLPAEPCFVIPVRHPNEVAASLAARDGIPPAMGRLLWLRHVLAAERETRGQARIFISYQDLLADWRAAVSKVFAHAGLALPDLESGGAIAAEVEAYLDPRLRHHVARGEAAAGAELPRFVQSTWDWMIDAATGRAASPDALDAAAGSLRDAELAFAPLLLELDPDRSAAADRGDRGATALRSIGAHRLPLERRLGEVERSLAKAEREREQLSLCAERLEAGLAGLAAAATVQDARFVRVAGETTRLDVAGVDVQTQLALLCTRQAQLDEAVSSTQAANGDLRARLDDLRARLDDQQARIAAAAQLGMATAMRQAKAGGPGLVAALLFAAPAWLVRHRGARRLRQWSEARIIARSGLFDHAYYLSANHDVASSGVDPLYHFVHDGAAEGRRPNALFDPGFYLASYPPARADGINPLVHFIARGAGLGWHPSALAAGGRALAGAGLHAAEE